MGNAVEETLGREQETKTSTMSRFVILLALVAISSYGAAAPYSYGYGYGYPHPPEPISYAEHLRLVETLVAQEELRPTEKIAKRSAFAKLSPNPDHETFAPGDHSLVKRTVTHPVAWNPYAFPEEKGYAYGAYPYTYIAEPY